MRKRNKETLKAAACFLVAITVTYFAFPRTMDIPMKYWIPLVIIVVLFMMMNSYLTKANIHHGKVVRFCEIPDGDYRWELTARDASLRVYILRNIKTLGMYGVTDFPWPSMDEGMEFKIENGRLQKS